MGEDYYDLLGISENATQDEIKKGYREKAKKMHPDKNTAPNAHENFLTIKKAYDILKDPTEKRKYDLTRRSSRACHSHYTSNPGPSYQHPFHRQSTFTFNFTYAAPKQKTPSFFNSSKEYQQHNTANKVYNEYMDRMRKQRREDMERRKAAFSQENHEKQKKEDIEKMKKMARLKLFWAKMRIYNIHDLKERVKASVAFKNPLLNGNSAIMGFSNAQEALKAEEIIAENFEDIRVTWVTPKPKPTNKNPIILSDEEVSDVEIVEDHGQENENDEDVEFINEHTEARQFVISSDDSEDEVEEVHQERSDPEEHHVDEDLGEFGGHDDVIRPNVDAMGHENEGHRQGESDNDVIGDAEHNYGDVEEVGEEDEYRVRDVFHHQNNDPILLSDSESENDNALGDVGNRINGNMATRNGNKRQRLDIGRRASDELTAKISRADINENTSKNQSTDRLGQTSQSSEHHQPSGTRSHYSEEPGPSSRQVHSHAHRDSSPGSDDRSHGSSSPLRQHDAILISDSEDDFQENIQSPIIIL